MRSLHLYNSILLLMAILSGSACSSYGKLSVSNKVLLPDESSGYVISDASGEKKSALNSGGHKSLLITSEKYLARGRDFSPESLILNMGVKEAINGNYIEAEILFKEIQNNSIDGSIENNLAIIYELTKRNNDAMNMYYKAINKSPENSKFRCNLLSFINHTKFIPEDRMNSKTGNINVKR